MRLLEGIGTIVFGLWVISQGTEPGASIMIVLGLPVVLFGIVQTMIGFAKSMKEKTPDLSEAGLERPPKESGPVPSIENDLSFADSVERGHHARERNVRVRSEQEAQEQRSKKKACPECGAKYGLFDLVTQPTMCSQCWKKSNSSSVR